MEIILIDWVRTNTQKEPNESILKKIKAVSVPIEEFVNLKLGKQGKNVFSKLLLFIPIQLTLTMLGLGRQPSLGLDEFEVVKDVEGYKSVHLVTNKDDGPEYEDIKKSKFYILSTSIHIFPHHFIINNKFYFQT